MKHSSGSRKIVIGVIDGPVNLSHPALQGSQISTINNTQTSICGNVSSAACMHGTFIVGILAAMRGTKAPGICPSCKLLIYPVFEESSNVVSQPQILNRLFVPNITIERLSDAIIQTTRAGARIINLSLGPHSIWNISDKLHDAYNYACKNNVIIVAATGNHGMIGSSSLLRHPWITPVAACDEHGKISPMSNYGPSIANRGFMAPGVNIVSTSSDGEYTKGSGTSVAAPFVTGTIALLWSMFPDAKATELLYSIRKLYGTIPRRTIVPPLLNAEAIWNYLKYVFSKTQMI
jgi:subtilisin family serine protease